MKQSRRRNVCATSRSLSGAEANSRLAGFDSAQANLSQRPHRLLEGMHIAVARDAAFAFLYPANLDCLRELGAELAFFSPLQDKDLPEADAVYLPGGYPELHLDTLAGNGAMKQALRGHAVAGQPIYAECGGMLYLLDSLADAAGREAAMAGLLPGKAVLGKRLAALGYQSLPLPEGELRGHTFHYSTLETPLFPAAYGQPLLGAARGEGFYRHGSVRASYLHLFFPSGPQAAAALFRR